MGLRSARSRNYPPMAAANGSLLNASIRLLSQAASGLMPSWNSSVWQGLRMPAAYTGFQERAERIRHNLLLFLLAADHLDYILLLP